MWNKVIDTDGRSVLPLLCNSHRSVGVSFVLRSVLEYSVRISYCILHAHSFVPVSLCYLMNVPRAAPFSRDTICVLYSN